MSCTRTAQMESVVMGEVPPALERLLREHAGTCVACGHELRWLETEQLLFAKRAGREAVQKAPPVLLRTRTSRGERLAVISTLAATVLLTVFLGSSSRREFSAQAPDELLSSPTISLDSTVEDDSTKCSKLPPLIGFQCKITTSSASISQ